MSDDYEEMDYGKVKFYDKYAESLGVPKEACAYELDPSEIIKEAEGLESHVDYRYWPVFKYLIDHYRREMFW